MDDATPDPADIPAPGSYHWTPKLQRAFLESLATTGSVKIASASVGMSPRDLRPSAQAAGRGVPARLGGGGADRARAARRRAARPRDLGA
jgi:hypothetical protein